MFHLLLYFGAQADDPCTFKHGISSFLGFPHWYEYLPGTFIYTDPKDPTSLVCNPQLTNLSDIWLIAAAVIEILIRLAALAAIAFVIYGGVTYMLSQGEPEKTTKARHTIINALTGLAVAVIAAAAVAFIAGSVN
jgi:ABC-type Fe3+ transport system permease subunit